MNAPEQQPSARDAATQERLDRLENARRKLKKYRARTSNTSSIGSSRSSLSSTSRRDSSHTTVEAIPAAHRHRKSLSRTSIAGPGIVPPSPGGPRKTHVKRMSASRGSRGASFGGGHGHTRSRASISISAAVPKPAPILVEPPAPVFAPVASGSKLAQASSRAPLDTPVSWKQGSFPNSPELRRGSSPVFSEPSTAPSHSYSPSTPAVPSSHVRRASRHNRRSSVANFRESLDLLSGQHLAENALLQPGTSSFAPVDGSPPSPSTSNKSLSPNPAANRWNSSADPEQVLEALKERGRMEAESSEVDPVRLRNAALEALEGRLAAPSEMIGLGTDDELLSTPASPGFVGAAFPLSPSTLPVSSPMVGLGLGGKRHSWSTPGPVTSAGAKGAMDLGMLIEEEEEEADDEEEPKSLPASPRRRGSPKASPKSSPKSPRKRPASLFLTPSVSQDAIPFTNSTNPTPISSAFAARPMRLSLSLSSPASSTAVTPSTAASQSQPTRPPPLRSLTLGANPSSTPLARSTSSESDGTSEKRTLSLFHSIAVEDANGNLVRSGPPSPTPPSAAPKGLRSLSMAASPASPPVNSNRSFFSDRNRSSTSTSASTASTPARSSVTKKRSSISYRTTSGSSVASPDGLSNASPAARRSWRPPSFSASSPSMTAPYGNAFPFAPMQGDFGGFGDLEVDMDHEGPSATTFDDSESLLLQIAALKAQAEQLKNQSAHVASTHALEIAEFEKKAGEEAGEMRSRISDLERALEADRVGRRFEVEGLTREVEQAREIANEVAEERDALREDVDGWRTRCSTLQSRLKKEHEDDALATAQAKLIGEMRDQIYNLVAALERERSEHAETRNELDHLFAQTSPEDAFEDEPEDDDEEAGLGTRNANTGRHAFQSISDRSVLSVSSFGRSYSGNTTEDTSMTTDNDDSFSAKMSSPPSGHSSFGQAIGFPTGSKRDSDFGASPALHTLTEEEEDEEAARAEAVAARTTSSSGSTSASEGMPPTPSKDAPTHHSRSDSFVRHWSFPKGSVSSLRLEDPDAHSFFDLNRHTSLPALPIADSILPPFLHADLTVDDDASTPAPVQIHHFRRPSSPRPMAMMAPHTRRFSGQYAAKAPPVSPSALAHVAIQSSATPAAAPAKSGLGRFGSLLGSLGGWAPAAIAAPAMPPATQSKLAISTTLEVEETDEADVYLSSTSHQTPPSLLHSSRAPQRYIKAAQQPTPRQSRLARLDFTPVCCAHEVVYCV